MRKPICFASSTVNVGVTPPCAIFSNTGVGASSLHAFTASVREVRPSRKATSAPMAMAFFSRAVAVWKPREARASVRAMMTMSPGDCRRALTAARMRAR